MMLIYIQLPGEPITKRLWDRVTDDAAYAVILKAEVDNPGYCVWGEPDQADVFHD